MDQDLTPEQMTAQQQALELLARSGISLANFFRATNSGLADVIGNPNAVGRQLMGTRPAGERYSPDSAVRDVPRDIFNRSGLAAGADAGLMRPHWVVQV
jgi:hypothetical protein